VTTSAACATMFFPDIGAVLEAHRASLDGADDLLFSMPHGGPLVLRRFGKRYRRPAGKKALPERLHPQSGTISVSILDRDACFRRESETGLVLALQPVSAAAASSYSSWRCHQAAPYSSASSLRPSGARSSIR
jgi:hypothetical protein